MGDRQVAIDCYKMGNGKNAMTTKPRAYDLGIPLEGTPEPFNASRNIGKIEVGTPTFIDGNNCRKDVTNIHPRRGY